MTTRRGSFLLVCIGMMSLMVIIGFALLRNLRTQVDASTVNQRTLLAQSAAQAGVEHATEFILGDYASDKISVKADLDPSGKEQVKTLTFLDGRYRAPFLALAASDRPDYDYNKPDADKDVRPEHHLLRPLMTDGWSDSYWSWTGTSHNVGRARYYEPEYLNVSPLDGAPVAPVSFVDPAPAAPERDAGIYFDEHFRRIDDADHQRARQEARYRLRYAVNVDDLSGHLLINPMADMKPQDYRTPPNWMARSGDALGTMMTAQLGSMDASDTWAAARVEHVFLGRGWSNNVDVDANGIPITFPRMYRIGAWDTSQHGGWNDAPYFTSFQNWPGWWGLTRNLYHSAWVPGKKDGGEPLYVSWQEWWRTIYMHSLTGPQMSFWNFFYAAMAGNYWSDWVTRLNAYEMQFSTTPFGRSLTQPQGYPATYHAAKRKWYEGRVNTPFYVNLLTCPPWVVNAMLVSYLPPKYKIFKYTWMRFWKWGKDGDNNDTWIEINGLPIDGSDPRNNSGQYGRDLLVDTTVPAFAEFPAPFRDKYTNPPSPVAGEVVKPDYFCDDPRFNYPKVDSSGNPVLDGNGNMTYEAHIERVYPGKAWNGNPDNLGEGTDDAGKALDSDSLGYGVDVHTWQPFVRLDPPPPWLWRNWFPADWKSDVPTNHDADWKASSLTIVPPDEWKTTDPQPDQGYGRALKVPDPHRVKFQDSYWWDIYCAMAMAVSVTRAQWYEYDNGYFSSAPGNMFPNGRLDPSSYHAIRDLDRQFLAELGESLETPNSHRSPQQLVADPTHPIRPYHLNWDGNGNLQAPYFAPWVPANNIASALAQKLLSSGNPYGTAVDANNQPLPVSGMTDEDRAKVMERVLNDFRMSFMGASPEYSDGIDDSGVPRKELEFRPLDFDGDGEVYCSCYQNPDAMGVDANGVPVGVNVITLPHASADADGRGPKPDDRMYFSPTGCFFTGKSHYYRIISRGEVWDNALKTIATEATLDSVLAVDPEGNDPKQTQTLYQRWHFDTYLGMMPHVKP